MSPSERRLRRPEGPQSLLAMRPTNLVLEPSYPPLEQHCLRTVPGGTLKTPIALGHCTWRPTWQASALQAEASRVVFGLGRSPHAESHLGASAQHQFLTPCPLSWQRPKGQRDELNLRK